ncbi:MAG: hypothetical protein AAGF49_03110 [Pseudomonadota bacterium]
MVTKASIRPELLQNEMLGATLQDLTRLDIHLEAKDYRRPPPLLTGIYELLTGNPFAPEGGAQINFHAPDSAPSSAPRIPVVWLRIDTRYGDLASGLGRRIELATRLESLSPPVLRSLSEQRALLVLDWSHEGRPTFWTSNIANIVNGFSISPQNVVILTQNLAPHDPPEPGTPDINIINAHAFIAEFWRLFFGEKLRKDEFDAPFGFAASAPPERSHHYVCLNYEASAPRAALAALLRERPQRGFLSFRKNQFRRNMPGSTAFESDLDTISIPENRDLHRQLVERFIAARGNHTVDLVSDTPEHARPFLPLEAFRKSMLNIITEKEMALPDQQRFTEKTLKAIIAGLPFVVFGNQGTIRILRDAGFDVLSDFIDHSYDEAPSPAERFDGAFRVVDAFLKRRPGFTPDEHARLQAAAAHNRKIFERPFFQQWVLSPINEIVSRHPEAVPHTSPARAHSAEPATTGAL